MRIVIINGHVACLKTTLGYLLAPVLQMGHVTTSVLGDFVSDATSPSFEAFREARYRKATSITRQFLADGVPVLLDGTFARREWRNAIYQLASDFGVRDVISVTCFCSDPLVIYQRLAYRRCASNTPDAAANHWDAYAGSVKTFESPQHDKLPGGLPVSRLSFDSANYTIHRESVYSAGADATAAAIERLVDSGRLARPQFGHVTSSDTPSLSVATRVIALEGIGGSGKSTQANRLSESFSADGKRTALLDEFSNSPIGELLRSRTGIEDHRVQATDVPPSHTESLLVIGDAVARARTLEEARRDGSAKYDVLIADGSTWSYLAHALALLPRSAGAAARTGIGAVVAELAAPIRTLAEHYVSIFIKVPVEVAVDRLERRLGRALTRDARSFLVTLADTYAEFSVTTPTVTVDGTGSPDEVASRIMFSLQPILRD